MKKKLLSYQKRVFPQSSWKKTNDNNYKEFAENVKKNGLFTYGFMVKTDKATLLELSELDQISYIGAKDMTK